ncbi:gastrula zinc finger protein XlCGF7.1-like isoform X2 [Folsomia candida]|uniref:gastrula zinc finger protein XlCGF7.1-like isoform X2 n=1 Tax=Folsomia candida TaxID=158441 RepID=UPI001604D48A|nr:gastrula zinc finger protein XlCGF7.1-like isoform X2 [Folsomia candida]
MLNMEVDVHTDFATHDPNAKVKCQICWKFFKNPPSLYAHMRRIHSNRERPSCPTCHRVFSRSTNVRAHIKAVHSTRERPRVPCTFPGCGNTYQNKGGLGQHMKIEHAENPIRFPCTLCRKSFKTKADFEKHISTHTTEKPFECTKCGRSFAVRASMKTHEMTHLEKSARAMLQCHICTPTLLTRRALKHHIRLVHENRRNYPIEASRGGETHREERADPFLRPMRVQEPLGTLFSSAQEMSQYCEEARVLLLRQAVCQVLKFGNTL